MFKLLCVFTLLSLVSAQKSTVINTAAKPNAWGPPLVLLSPQAQQASDKWGLVKNSWNGNYSFAIFTNIEDCRSFASGGSVASAKYSQAYPSDSSCKNESAAWPLFVNPLNYGTVLAQSPFDSANGYARYTGSVGSFQGMCSGDMTPQVTTMTGSVTQGATGYGMKDLFNGFFLR